MADKVTRTKLLKLVAQFSDGDDRTLTQPDPRSNLQPADFGGEFKAYAAKALLGDKTGAAFSGWKSAKVYDTTTVHLDLTTA